MDYARRRYHAPGTERFGGWTEKRSNSIRPPCGRYEVAGWILCADTQMFHPNLLTSLLVAALVPDRQIGPIDAQRVFSIVNAIPSPSSTNSSGSASSLLSEPAEQYPEVSRNALP